MAVEVAYKYASSSDANELYLEQIEDGGAHYAGERTAIVIIEEGLQVALNLRGGNLLLRFVLGLQPPFTDGRAEIIRAARAMASFLHH